MVVLEFGFWLFVVFMAVAFGTVIFKFIIVLIGACLEILYLLIPIGFIREILKFFINLLDS